MQQNAVSDASLPADDNQDALRLQVEQMLERRHLKKSRTEADAEPAPVRTGSLRRTPPQEPARNEPAPPADPFEEEIAKTLSFDSVQPFEMDEGSEDAQQFAPRDELPMPERQPDRRQGERREAERRNMEFLRTEIQWSTTDDASDKRPRFSGFSGLKSSRFLLVGVAIVSAAVAMALVLSNAPPEPAPVQPVAAEAPTVPTARILVAASTIAAGQRLSGDSLTWREVPADDVLPEYVAEEANPDALATAEQSLARYAFFPGDPIRTDKLIERAQGSLSTTLTPGLRGVSVVVTPESAAGGFIKPDDYVDVLIVSDDGGRKVANTVLRNVRVIAINSRLGPDTTGEVSEDPTEATQTFEGPVRATLELDPRAAEVLVRAAASGPLTLTLRSDQDVTPGASDARRGANQAIRLTSPFWTSDYTPVQ